MTFINGWFCEQCGCATEHENTASGVVCVECGFSLPGSLKDVKARKKAYRERVDVKARQKAYQKEWAQRVDVKARQKAYYQRVDVKARQKAYYQRVDVKARQKAYYQRLEARLATLRMEVQQ